MNGSSEPGSAPQETPLDQKHEALNRASAKWYTYSTGVNFAIDETGIRIPNQAAEPGEVRQKLPDIAQPGIYEVTFEGYPVQGEPGVLHVVDPFNHVFATVSLWSTALVTIEQPGEYEFMVKVPGESCMHVSKATIRPAEGSDPHTTLLDAHLHGKVAVVVPNYPTPENKYLCAFVHARVKAYRDARIPVDVISAYDYPDWNAYRFEDVDVLRIPIDDLPAVLEHKGYRAIMVHFFDLAFAAALESASLGTTPIILWSHNPETQYWDWPLFASRYFEDPVQITPEQRTEFEARDQALARFDAMPNVSWVFISDAQLERARELTGCAFSRAHVIPNVVDEHVFSFRPKSADLRRRVLVVRKFDNVSTYAVDIDVAAIVELSKRECFADMEFDFFGTGDFYDKLVEPLAGFDNVTLHKRFATREEIAYAHQDHGIALFASRYDSQGVSMCEAAMSGLAVVASDIPAARTFLPQEEGLLCDVEDAKAYADCIERLYNDPEQFQKSAAACHEHVAGLCGRNATIARELELLAQVSGIHGMPSAPSLGEVASSIVSKVRQVVSR